MTHPGHEVLRRTYAAFNTRDLEGALAAMHPEVEWPNAMEGGMVHGHNGIREYWSRQWKMIDPHVEPVSSRQEPDGRIVLDVHQVVRDFEGKVLIDQMVEHAYSFKDGLISRMDIGAGKELVK